MNDSQMMGLSLSDVDGKTLGKEEVNLFGLGVVFVRGQGTARRNDGPPTCYSIILYITFFKNFWGRRPQAF